MKKLIHLMKNGWSSDQLSEYACNEFGVSERQGREYVHYAMDACVEAVSVMDKRRIAAITLLRFENAYRLAAAQRNPQAMIAANAQIAQHWVHHAPEITVNSTATGDDHDPDEDF